MTKVVRKGCSREFRFDKTFYEANTEPMFITKSSLVWHLVVMIGSKETIKLFLSKKVNLHGKNNLDYNFVHNMALAAAFEPESEDEMMIYYG